MIAISPFKKKGVFCSNKNDIVSCLFIVIFDTREKILKTRQNYATFYVDADKSIIGFFYNSGNV